MSRYLSPQDHADRAEDIAWMIQCGEGTTGAAKRVGLSPDALQRWTQRTEHRDLWLGLCRNDLLQAGYSPAEIDREGVYTLLWQHRRYVA